MFWLGALAPRCRNMVVCVAPWCSALVLCQFLFPGRVSTPFSGRFIRMIPLGVAIPSAARIVLVRFWIAVVGARSPRSSYSGSFSRRSFGGVGLLTLCFRALRLPNDREPIDRRDCGPRRSPLASAEFVLDHLAMSHEAYTCIHRHTYVRIFVPVFYCLRVGSWAAGCLEGTQESPNEQCFIQRTCETVLRTMSLSPPYTHALHQ